MNIAAAFKKKRTQFAVAVLGLMLGCAAIYWGVLESAMSDARYQCRPFLEGDVFDQQMFFKRQRDLRTDRKIETYSINQSPPVEVFILKMPGLLGRGAACEIRVATKIIQSVRTYHY